jgi:hypothetical protein
MKKEYKQDRLQIEKLRANMYQLNCARIKAYNEFLVQVRECEQAYQYGRGQKNRLAELKNLRRALNALIGTYAPKRTVSIPKRKSRLNGTRAFKSHFLNGETTPSTQRYSYLLKELQRYGFLVNNELLLTGKQCHSLHCYLVSQKIIRNVPMTEFYKSLAETFKLRFKTPSSLQRHRQSDADFIFWERLLNAF